MSYTVTNNYKDATGTSLLGYIHTTYARLYSIFGKPVPSNDYKTNSEWIIRFADGKIATIYDYKEKNTPIEEYDWHIGGNDRIVVERIHKLVNG